MDVSAINSSAGPEVSFLPSRTNPSEKAQVPPALDAGMMPNVPQTANGTATAHLGSMVGQKLNVKA